jgi:hypothetical protein
MRLSTEPDRDDERSVVVLHAALDAGVTLLDTADAYCWSDSEAGVQLIDRHQLNPERCLYVGGGSQDAGFARKLGFTHAISLRLPTWQAAERTN